MIWEWISSLEHHWLFEPFNRVALETVGLWWFVAFMIVIGLSALGYALGINPDVDLFPDDMGPLGKVLTVVVAAPLIEETIFRILPSIMGASFEVMLGLTVLWVLLHGKRFPVIALFAPIYLKLALGGFLVEAIVVHAIHNTIAVIPHLIREDYME